jgi:hypothetical protein
MARKIQIQTSNSIGTWIAKNNKMSDYFGDLDNLDSHFESSRYGKDDSNFVSALNHLHREVDSIFTAIFDSGGVFNISTLYADSAVINRLRVNSLYADSAEIDSAFVHKVTGHHLRFDSADIDSARIRNLSGEYLNFDSAKFRKITVDSAYLGNVSLDEVTINNKFNFDSQSFTHVFPFTIKDSVGKILLGGYFLSTDSDISTP